MDFSDKLSLLMDLTKTTNSALSRYVCLDASYISRLRSGKRFLPRNDDIVQNMAAYFARNCKGDFRKKALADTLGCALPKDYGELSKMIHAWMMEEKTSGGNSVEHFLGGLSRIPARSSVNPNMPPERSENPRRDLSVYYGIEGKRQAVISFLSEVIEQENPQTLLLYSDEETSWMTADPEFAQQWASLMFQTLTKGHKIKIIHTISRDLDEMLSAIAQWMPLYMSGSIEPYFYPKKRDGVFKRTLFILPEKTAVVSNSIGDQTHYAANLLFHEKEAVSAHQEEFLKYLKLCRPLMRIFNSRSKLDCLKTLEEFEKEQCNALIKTESLMLLTMEKELLCQILERNRLTGTDILNYHGQRLISFKQLLINCIFTEIITLPDPQSVLDGTVKIVLSDLLENGALYYTVEEFILHLKCIIEHLRTYANYHVHLHKGPRESGYAVYVKEELGAIVVKTSLPSAVLAISESNMTAAFWDFLLTLIGQRAYASPQKESIAEQLNQYIETLENLISAKANRSDPRNHKEL